jgi:hypothetical protein
VLPLTAATEVRYRARPRQRPARGGPRGAQPVAHDARRAQAAGVHLRERHRRRAARAAAARPAGAAARVVLALALALAVRGKLTRTFSPKLDYGYLFSLRLPRNAPPFRALSLIPTVTGNTVRSLSTHGQQSAAQGSSTTVSRSDIRLMQHLDSSAHGLVRRWLLIGYFPIHLIPLSVRGGPEVEHGAHFLILYYPFPCGAHTLQRLASFFRM